MDLIIERSRWLRGENDGKGNPAEPTLRDFDGNMCCLGFYCLALGVTINDMLEIPDPQHLIDATGDKFKDSLKYLVKSTSDKVDNTKICVELMDVNDSYEKTEGMRERGIRARFKKMGVNVTFVD